jgi:hypothetical protein
MANLHSAIVKSFLTISINYLTKSWPDGLRSETLSQPNLPKEDVAVTCKSLAFIAGAALFTTSALAGSPTVMLGIAFDFGANPKENIGITGKVISNDQPGRFVVGAGGTYFPFAREQFGADISGGYLTDHAAVTAGYDFMRWTPQISAGWAPTK